MRLALDTSTPWSSIALVDDGALIAARDLSGVNPGEAVVAAIDEMCTESGLSRAVISGIDVGVGPGPYTSTRVGVAIARTLGFALAVEVAGVCSHDAIAAQVVGTAADGLAEGLAGEIAGSEFVVATDARRSEVYWARYGVDGRRIAGPTVGKPADVAQANQVAAWFGNGLDRHRGVVDEFGIAVGEQSHPVAIWIAAVAESARRDGHGVPTSQPELADHSAGAAIPIDLEQRLFAPYPLYLRRPDAVPPSAKAGK